MPTYSTTSLGGFTIGSADISTATASSSTTTSASITPDPYYYPTTTTSSYYAAVSSPSIGLYVKDYEKECKEMCDKVEQHIDQLEEDIQFFNDKREESENLIKFLHNSMASANAKITELEKEITGLKGYTSWLESELMEMKNKDGEELR